MGAFLTPGGGLELVPAALAALLPAELPAPLTTVRATDWASGPNRGPFVRFVYRIENMNRERLRKKRINSAIKASRRVDMD